MSFKDESSIQVRSLVKADLSRVADLHLRAFPGFFLSSLGKRFLVLFYRAHLLDPSAVAVVATRGPGGPILGVAVGTTNPGGFYSRLLRRDWLRFALAAVPTCFRKPKAAIKVARAVAYRGEGETGTAGALLSSICVAPETRGGGTGRALLTNWLQRVASSGIDRAYLSTDAEDNEATLSFYAGLGWVRSSERVTPEGRRMLILCRDLELDSALQRRPRVLHIVAGDSFGGASRIIESVVKHLASTLDVEVAVSEPKLADLLESGGVVVHRAPAIARRIAPRQDLRATRELAMLMRQRNYHLVHTHTSKGGIVGRAAAVMANVPIRVHTIHNFAISDDSPKLQRIMNYGVERVAARFTTQLTTVSRHLAEQAKGAGIRGIRPTVTIPNGIPDVPSSVVEASSGSPIVTYHGRLAAGKGIEDLLRAARRVSQSGIQFELRLVGAGEHESTLRELAERLGFGPEIFVGFSTDVAAEIAMADVCVQPSYREGMSIALLEAMRGAKPIVSSDIAANREVLGDPAVALVYPVGNVDGLAERLRVSLMDRAASSALGEEARTRFLAEYESAVMCQRYADLYGALGVLGKPQGGEVASLVV